MQRKIAFLLALLLSLTTLTACRKPSKTVSCQEILTALTQAELFLPAGRVYNLSAQEGENEYLSRSLIRALYGNSNVSDGWIDCALFLPTVAHPCEFAVVLCRDHDTANDTATLFSSRLLSIRHTKTDSAHADLLNRAKVTILGNYVLLIISSDSENALRTAKDVIKGAY